MRLLARTALALTAAVAVSACDRSIEAAEPTTEPAATPAAPAAPATAPLSSGGLAIEGEGLRIFDVSGAARALPFGTPQATVIAAVTAATGGAAPEESTNEECGQGPVQFAQYANGLDLLFKEGEFKGWFLDEAGLTTADGIGVGTPRATLAAARTVEMTPDSTLGAEFSAGDLNGFLTSTAAEATVESLWGGDSCFFR